jgi:hypothetical protein
MAMRIYFSSISGEISSTSQLFRRQDTCTLERSKTG